MRIRTLEPHEVDLHRELRLRALLDSPDSFGETFAAAEKRPLSYWENLTRSVTDPGPHVMFLACEGDDALGSTYGLLDRETSDAGRIGGTWVDPSRRRQGVARTLLEAVFAWARERKLKRLGLWAPAHSPRAIALYQQTGFHKTGSSRPLPTDPELTIIEMLQNL